MPGRQYYNETGYRYSINGQEKSPEVAPNTTTAEFWQYDARIVRRCNVDPVVKVYESPYASFANNPIIYVDINGSDTINFNKSAIIIIPQKGRNWSGGSQATSGNTSFSISTTPAVGKDVFIYTSSVTVVNGENSNTVSTTTVMDPFSDKASGVTKGRNLYFDGLITTERNNSDWESVGKFMNLDRGFYDYMITRNPDSKHWRAKALAIEAMELVMPVLVQSGLGAWAGFRFSGVKSSSYTALKYDPRVRIRALEDPISHNFPYSFDKYILNTTPVLKNNGYKIYQLEGTLHGKIVEGEQQIKKGFYEIGVRKDGVIDHRFFRATGTE